jgi:hypothetical protein
MTIKLLPWADIFLVISTIIKYIEPIISTINLLASLLSEANYVSHRS